MVGVGSIPFSSIRSEYEITETLTRAKDIDYEFINE